jgi:outer membrane protein W
MKKILASIVIALIMNVSSIMAQESGKFRVGFDLGMAVPQGGGAGLGFYLEPKYNLNERMNIGIRYGGAATFRNIELNQSTSDVRAEVGATGTLGLTFDYYFINGSKFVPFIGGGIGYYGFANIEIDSSVISDDAFLDTSMAVAPMIRGGFEFRKLRLSLDYNILPSSELVNMQNQRVGVVANSYLGITLGLYVGGGKW